MGKDRTLTLKMAATSREDLDEFGRFSRQIEMINSGWWRDFQSCELKNDKEILLIEETVNGGINYTQWLDAWMPFLSSGVLFRILGGYETMFSAACDPDQNSIEWKPEIQKILTDAGYEQDEDESETED